MKNALIHVYDFNLMYAKKLIQGIPEERLGEQVAGIPNHPLWVMGHLANTCDFAGEFLGLESAASDEQGKLFGRDSSPQADASIYPDIQKLISDLEAGHQRVAEAFLGASTMTLAAVNSVERMRERFPRVMDVMAFILTSHESLHLGQVSSWRRAAGLPSAF